MATLAAMMKDAPPGERAGNRIVSTPFLAHLVIAYAFDAQARCAVSESGCEKLGLAAAVIERSPKNPTAAPPASSGPAHPAGNSPDQPRQLRGFAHPAHNAERARGAVKATCWSRALMRDYVLYTARAAPRVLKRFRTHPQYENAPPFRALFGASSAGWQRVAAR